MFLETDEISYDDKSHVVFYNASAYDKVTDNEELKAVLRFVYENKSQSEYTDKLEDSSKTAKSRSEWEDDYMYFQDILEEEKEQAREIGLAEGREKGLEEGINQKAVEDAFAFYKNGVSIEIIAKSLNMSINEVKQILKQ